jgi:hypothetical protein
VQGIREIFFGPPHDPAFNSRFVDVPQWYLESRSPTPAVMAGNVFASAFKSQQKKLFKGE